MIRESLYHRVLRCHTNPSLLFYSDCAPMLGYNLISSVCYPGCTNFLIAPSYILRRTVLLTCYRRQLSKRCPTSRHTLGTSLKICCYFKRSLDACGLVSKFLLLSLDWIVQQFQNENIAVPVKFELWVIKKMFCVH